MDVTYSIKNVPIRLPYERWYHITENHDDLSGYFFEILEAVEKPEFICMGNKGTLKAVKKATDASRDKFFYELYINFSIIKLFRSGH